MLRSVILSALCYALCVCCAAHLSVKLSCGDGQKITAIVSNDGDETLKILHHPLTIFTTFPTDTFKFTAKIKDSVPPRFKGVQIKYSPQAAIAAGAFTYLAPGQSVQIQHDLTKAYDFSESGEGVYQIDADNLLYVVGHDGSVQTLHADVSGTQMRMPVASVHQQGELQKRATFVGCSSARQVIIITAANQASTYASESYSYLAAHTTATTRYTTWFGAYTAARHSTVTAHFQQMSSSNYSSYTYDCTCTDTSSGYIYPDGYPTIYLCSSFWTLPLLGFDGQAATILKLSSQFTVNGGTSELVYGTSACKSLAVSKPAQAIASTENVEYFAINDPPLA